MGHEASWKSLQPPGAWVGFGLAVVVVLVGVAGVVVVGVGGVGYLVVVQGMLQREISGKEPGPLTQQEQDSKYSQDRSR